METDYKILSISQQDILPVHELLKNVWGTCIITSKERIHQADELPGFIAVQNGLITGLVTFHLDGKQCEIVTLNSVNDDKEMKIALVRQVNVFAGEKHCYRVWLIITNDNTPCLALLQKIGFSICQFYKNAVDFTRHINPNFPLYGIDNIPIRDEIELEFIL